MAVVLVSVLATVLSPARAHAWGDEGHEAVCEIALRELSRDHADLVAKITRLLSKEQARFQAFAVACTWPDTQKGNPHSIQHARKPEHFINVPRGTPAISAETCAPAKKCLFTAIRDDEAALKPNSGKNRPQALKFLGHWLGDLHQPLHVSFADDAGGNAINVASACKEIHAEWDTCIPRDLMQQLGVDPKDGVGLGDKLQNQITDAERTTWRAGSLAEWAQESYAVTLDKGTDYCTLKGTQCCYPVGTTCKHAGAARSITLPPNYDDQHVQIVQERMKQGGVRLAKVLAEALQ